MQYEINPDTLVLMSMDNRKCKVIEKQNQYIINNSSFNIMEHSCSYFGCTYLGRQEGTKQLIGSNYKAPIVVEETNKIIFFPTTSPLHPDCIWIALNQIKNYYQGNTKETSIIEFKNDDVLQLNVSIGSLQNQILRATRLKVVMEERLQYNKN